MSSKSKQAQAGGDTTPRSVLQRAAGPLCALALAIGTLTSAHAATLVNNGNPDTTTGTNFSAFRVAENFSLASSSIITGINLWALMDTPATAYSGTMSWVIYADNAGSPGAVLSSGSTAAAASATPDINVIGTLDEFAITLNGLSINLGAGSYFLGLQDATAGGVNAPDFLWAGTSGGTAPLGKYFDGAWFDTDNEHAFAIIGDRVVEPPPPPGVPEPGTLALLALGLLAAGASRRKA